MPAAPEKVLRAIRAGRGPRRDGKRFVYDEELSIRTVSTSAGKRDGSGFTLVDE
jgi:hypothetical protein